MKEESSWADTDDVWMGHILEPECEIKKSEKKRSLIDKEKKRERRTKSTVHSKPILRFKLKALVPTSDGKYKCKICGELFSSAKRYHYLKHEKTRPFSCDVCGKTFHLSWHLNSHKKSHDNTELFKCEVCNKAVKNLKQHQILHMNVFPFRCDACEKNFRFRSELKIHNESCHSDVKHTCATCGKTYLLRHSLREHEKVAHNPFYIVKMFECEVCGQSVPKRNRARHMERHIGYTCDICGKCVTTKKSLDLHLLRHRGEKPLSCDVCGNNFVNLYTLTCHKRIHEGVKPYKCTECGKCFRQSGSLKIHARLHTGERPYSCQFCTDAFVSRTLLNTHVKNRHGVRD